MTAPHGRSPAATVPRGAAAAPRIAGVALAAFAIAVVRRRSSRSGSTSATPTAACARRSHSGSRSWKPPTRRRARRAKDAQDNLRDAQAKIALLENRLAESQTQQAALEALYRELAPSRDEWALTEIEQVLLLASQQLQLAGNVSGALAALQLADAKLQRLDRPQFVPLRRALARDMDRLKAVPYVDVAGLSLRLDQAIAVVDSLPLALEERLPASTPGRRPRTSRRGADSCASSGRTCANSCAIENLDRPEAPLLTPPQQFFLRENLKLRLLSARFDLLFRDQANFRADLAAAERWLKKYFDTRAKAVQSLQTLL